MTDITFTFAIVNWNTRDLLDRCLASIEAVKGDFSVQVLVADNHSSDGSADMVAEKYPRVELVRNTANLGFAAGHQVLLPLSKGTFHVLVNSDIELLPGCLEAMERRLLADTAIGVLGCRLIGPGGRTQPSCRRFPKLRYQFVEALGINRLFPYHRVLNAYKMAGFHHDHSREVDQVMGALFLIRRELIDKIGFLDTRFWMYYEEVDYCLRCCQAGYKVFFEADAQVRHEGGGSSRKVRILTIRRTVRSMRAFFHKHRGGWTVAPLLLIVSLDLVTHVIHALWTRNHPWQVWRAYALAWWDLVSLKRSDR